MKKYLLIAITIFLLLAPVSVMAQTESCPVDDDWIKFWRLDVTEFNYTAPEGKFVAETCQRESNSIFYFDIRPPRKHVTIESVTGGDIHYLSVRLVDKPSENMPPMLPKPPRRPIDPPIPPRFSTIDTINMRGK